MPVDRKLNGKDIFSADIVAESLGLRKCCSQTLLSVRATKGISTFWLVITGVLRKVERIGAVARIQGVVMAVENRKLFGLLQKQ